MSNDLRNVNLQLEISDLESQMRPCCGSSTTNNRCTCPIRFTDCCDGLDFARQ